MQYKRSNKNECLCKHTRGEYKNIRKKVKSTFNIAAIFFVYLAAAEVFTIFDP